MRRPHEEKLADDLHCVATRLREDDAEIDEHRVERLKERIFSGRRTRGRRSAPVQRLAAVLATFVIAGLSGGAFAIARFDHHPNTHGGAASAQYRPPKGCGKHKGSTEKKCKPAPKHKKKKKTKGAQKRRSPAFTG